MTDRQAVATALAIGIVLGFIASAIISVVTGSPISLGQVMVFAALILISGVSHVDRQ